MEDIVASLRNFLVLISNPEGCVTIFTHKTADAQTAGAEAVVLKCYRLLSSCADSPQPAGALSRTISTISAATSYSNCSNRK